MAAKTRSQIVLLAEDLLNAAGDLNWSTASKNRLADLANEDVWEEILRANPEWLTTRTSFTWPASTERIDLTGGSYLGAEAREILEIVETPNNAVPGEANVPRPWTPVGHTDRHRQRGPTRLPWSRSTGTVWSFQGDYVHADPVPAVAKYLHVTWVPQLAPLSGDSDTVLAGRCESYGNMVAVALARRMSSKDARNPMVEEQWLEALSRLKGATRRQRQRPRVVGGEGRL